MRLGLIAIGKFMASAELQSIELVEKKKQQQQQLKEVLEMRISVFAWKM